MSREYEIRVCQNPSCQMRYPVVDGQPFKERCPRCRTGTLCTARYTLDDETGKIGQKLISPLHGAMLDNIRSAWNVGSMFRSAEGFGLNHLYLCGITPTPADPGVKKTALGAEGQISWTHYNNSLAAAETLHQNGFRLWALEYTENAIPLDSVGGIANGKPIVLITGNERCGIDPGLIELCEQIIYIPMQGNKRSFNVAVAFGIAVHSLQSIFINAGKFSS